MQKHGLKTFALFLPYFRESIIIVSGQATLIFIILLLLIFLLCRITVNLIIRILATLLGHLPRTLESHVSIWSSESRYGYLLISMDIQDSPAQENQAVQS